MKNLSKIIPSVVLFIFINVAGKCQGTLLPPDEAQPDQLFLQVGLEPGIVSTIGYTHRIGQTNKRTAFYAGAGIKFAPLLISKGAWRSNLIMAMDWEMANKWGTRITNDFYLAHDNNREGVMNGIGFELRSATIHYGKKWNKGFELGWQYTIATHIKHSKEAKETFDGRYPGNINGISGPKDGWYGAAASRFRLGFITSTSLNNHLYLQLGLGSLLSVQKQGILLGFSHAQVPVYFESMLSYLWK